MVDELEVIKKENKKLQYNKKELMDENRELDPELLWRLMNHSFHTVKAHRGRPPCKEIWVFEIVDTGYQPAW